MRARATTFLASLDDDQRSATTFSFDDRNWRRWNYMTGSAVSPRLPLERMSDEQKVLALDLLRSGLSEAGMDKAERVMVLQDVLRDELNKGAPDRNSERFSTAIFGTPSDAGTWAWRFEGHHLTLTYTLVGDEIVSVTPSSFSSDPNTVASGPHRGLVALVDEEEMGRTLFRDLSAQNRDWAVLSNQSYGNVLALAGRENRIPDTPEGVPLADLTGPQIDLVTRMIDLYTIDHLAAPLADEQRARVREGDIMATRFGWAGADREGQSIYYRLHGETFVIEFASLRNQPLHLHTIRHDFERNLGAHRIG